MKKGQVSCGMKLKTITFLMKKKGSYCKHILETKNDKIDRKIVGEMKLRITGGKLGDSLDKHFVLSPVPWVE